MQWIKKSDLKRILDRWSEELPVYSPQERDGQAMLLSYDPETFTTDYINFPFPVKEFLFRQREILFRWAADEEHLLLEDPLSAAREKAKNEKKILFGIRACDADGLDYMDTFYIIDYRDEFYAKERENIIIVAVNCDQAGADCFCSSTKTGPFVTKGFDLLFTPIGDRYLLEVGSDKGQVLMDQISDFLEEADDEEAMKLKKDVEQKTLETFTTHIKTQDVPGVLLSNFTHPIWTESAIDCITCTGCTILCPTCTCFNVVEEADEKQGCRVRYWDSCQSDSFTRNAGDSNPRDAVSRVRYRILDKLVYIEEKFGKKGCTGCGRCIAVCPAAIDIVKIVNTLAEEEEK